MSSQDQLEPSKIGNPKGEKFRSFDELDQDILFDLGRRIIDWIETTTGGEDSHHFGIREAESDQECMRSGKATLRSLMMTSRKLNSIWTPISIQKVTLYAYQLPSFLLFLLKHPELGSKIRNLHFITREYGEFLDARDIVSQLLSMGHPQIEETESELSLASVMRILGEARSLIMEQLTNSREFTYNSRMSLPFKLSDSPRLVFSESLTSIKMVDFPMKPTESRDHWTGRQALTLLTFLPSLQSASMAFEFGYKDAAVINTHLPSLIESGRAVSKVKKLSLKFYLQVPLHESRVFPHDPVLNTFFSMFKSLENTSLTFIKDSRMNDDPRFPLAFEFPTTDLIKGLTGSSTTLKSLSVKGQGLGIAEEQTARDERFWSFLRRFRKLEHFRFESTPLFGAAISQNGFYRGPDIKSLELADNYTEDGYHAEVFFWSMLNAGHLPKSLELIRSPRRHLGPINQDSLVEGGEQFQRVREGFLEAAERSGVKVEFYG